MLNSRLKRSAFSLILAVVFMLSLFSVNVFAEDATEAETTAETVDETTAETTEETTDETTGETNAEDDHDHDHDHEAEEDKGLSTFDIVSLIILGVLVVVAVVYCVKNRQKVAKFLRSLWSESKKISWSSWKDVRKNTFVVLVVVIIAALVIAGVDALFFYGIPALRNLLV